MKVFTARCIYYITLLVAFILCFGGAFVPNFIIIGIGALIGFIGVIIWHIHGRWPYCKEHLGRHLPECCPHCGKKIE